MSKSKHEKELRQKLRQLNSVEEVGFKNIDGDDYHHAKLSGGVIPVDVMKLLSEYGVDAIPDSDGLLIESDVKWLAFDVDELRTAEDSVNIWENADEVEQVTMAKHIWESDDIELFSDADSLAEVVERLSSMTELLSHLVEDAAAYGYNHLYQEGDEVLFNDRVKPLTVKKTTENTVLLEGPGGGYYVVDFEEDVVESTDGRKMEDLEYFERA